MMFDDRTLRRHRLSALSNGVLIGMGMFFVLAAISAGGPPIIGIVPVAAGVGIEIWQRSRIPKRE